MSLDLDSMDRVWNRRWPEALMMQPWQINPALHVRFHNLPDSKRYPQNNAEYEIMLDRHNTVIQELNPKGPLFVIVSEWTNTPSPRPQDKLKLAKIYQNAVYWRTINENPEESDQEYQSYRHLYASKVTWRPGILDELLCAAASDEIAGVIIASEDLSWLYFPYDGGVDIVLSSVSRLDLLKKRHHDWLPTSNSGM